MTNSIEYIKLAKEFADQYGIEYLDRLITLAENKNLPNIQSNISHTNQVNQETILEEVLASGFQLNPWLKNLIFINSLEVVRQAIAVVEENEIWGNVRNREGLLVEAIRNQWKPKFLA
ncbi:MAG: hypothetical protein F6K22_25115 [Okeania sp. SIO2F4]|uniref:hypothetical protein n=1 Tax=Okeania sp. SIO2F4 TaxID=2607790 RepID=UPI00142C8191|nr:hypothetical protein [Okeania sp. SIO2F4]NES05799.1 hypothetical protein [Okeania sp. SIO2F4]